MSITLGACVRLSFELPQRAKQALHRLLRVAAIIGR